jgi:hypothetical protein
VKAACKRISGRLTHTMLTVNGAFKDVLKEGGSELTETNLMQMDEKK